MRKVIPSMQGVGSHNRNDCIIQAMTNALMLPYEGFKAIAEEHGWNPKGGIRSSASFDILTARGFSATLYSKRTNAARELRKIKSYGTHKIDDRILTLGAWLKTSEAQMGVNIVAIPWHVFCVRDGTIYDARCNSALCKIVAVYKLNKD